MKKSLKMLALGLAVVPCALVMTACGDGKSELNINTEGSYQVVKVTEYQNVLSDLENRGLTIENILGGARLTIDLGAEIGIADQTMTLDVASDNYLVNGSEAGQLDVNKLGLVSENSISIVSGTGDAAVESSGSANLYLKDGSLYFDLSGSEDLLTDFNVDSMIPAYRLYQTIASGTADDVATMPEFSITDILTYIPETAFGQSIIIETSKKGDDYKVKATVKGEFVQSLVEDALSGMASEAGMPTITFNSIGDIVIYVVYNADGFVGLNMSASVDMGLSIALGADPSATLPITIKGDVEINMASYNGSLDFPSNLNSDSYTALESTESSVAIA